MTLDTASRPARQPEAEGPRHALSFDLEAVHVMEREADNWAWRGAARYDSADLPARLAVLRRSLDGLPAGDGGPVALIIPDDQILFTDLQVDPGLPRREAVARSLDGLTPYAVEELDFDWVDDAPDRVKVAAVWRETLHEAQAFATTHGFNAVTALADTEAHHFPRAVRFGLGDVEAEDEPAVASHFADDEKTIPADAASVSPVTEPDVLPVTVAATLPPVEAEDAAADDHASPVEEPVTTPEPAEPAADLAPTEDRETKTLEDTLARIRAAASAEAEASPSPMPQSEPMPEAAVAPPAVEASPDAAAARPVVTQPALLTAPKREIEAPEPTLRDRLGPGLSMLRGGVAKTRRVAGSARARLPDRAALIRLAGTATAPRQAAAPVIEPPAMAEAPPHPAPQPAPAVGTEVQARPATEARDPRARAFHDRAAQARAAAVEGGRVVRQPSPTARRPIGDRGFYVMVGLLVLALLAALVVVPRGEVSPQQIAVTAPAEPEAAPAQVPQVQPAAAEVAVETPATIVPEAQPTVIATPQAEAAVEVPAVEAVAIPPAAPADPSADTAPTALPQPVRSAAPAQNPDRPAATAARNPVQAAERTTPARAATPSAAPSPAARASAAPAAPARAPSRADAIDQAVASAVSQTRSPRPARAPEGRNPPSAPTRPAAADAAPVAPRSPLPFDRAGEAEPQRVTGRRPPDRPADIRATPAAAQSSTTETTPAEATPASAPGRPQLRPEDRQGALTVRPGVAVASLGDAAAAWGGEALPDLLASMPRADRGAMRIGTALDAALAIPAQNGPRYAQSRPPQRSDAVPVVPRKPKAAAAQPASRPKAGGSAVDAALAEAEGAADAPSSRPRNRPSTAKAGVGNAAVDDAIAAAIDDSPASPGGVALTTLKSSPFPERAPRSGRAKAAAQVASDAPAASANTAAVSAAVAAAASRPALAADTPRPAAEPEADTAADDAARAERLRLDDELQRQAEDRIRARAAADAQVEAQQRAQAEARARAQAAAEERAAAARRQPVVPTESDNEPDAAGPVGGGTSNAKVAGNATLTGLDLRNPTLIGVIGAGPASRGLIRLRNGKIVTVRLGDRIDGGPITSIGDSAVTYVKSGRAFQLRMLDGR